MFLFASIDDFSDIHDVMYISCLGLTKWKLLVFVLKDIYIPTKVAICYIVTLDTMAVQLQLSIKHEESW